MRSTFAYPRFAYRPCPEQSPGRGRRRQAVVVGAGPVGLTAAIDLTLRGVPAVVLDADDTVSIGSRAICFAKRALEIWDRLGCAAPLLEKGVRWKVGKVFHGDRLLYAFDLLPESGHKMPAFINLQQYHVEKFLIDRAEAAGVDLRWRHRVVGADPAADGVALRVETPDGLYRLDADWVVACDGARSTMRKLLQLDFEGQVFDDRFLIADVVMRAGFPPERRFWFDPPFHRRQSALLHMQADDLWRIDFQLGREADPEEEKKPERVIPRLKAMLGEDVQFDLEWVSVYTFQCRRLRRFRHGRILFAGDAAHQLSPFGARGCNSGVEDAENLAWKLALVLAGTAPEGLLDSYDDERVPAADANIGHATRSTEFITPKTPASRAFRDAVLDLAADCPFARRLVNSGRLSTPAVYAASPLSTPDEDAFSAAAAPGMPCPDAPLRGDGGECWLLERVGGTFTGLFFGDAPPDGAAELAASGLPYSTLTIGPGGLEDAEGLAAQRLDATPGTFYLLRPDQYVAARWRRFDTAKAVAALRRAAGWG